MRHTLRAVAFTMALALLLAAPSFASSVLYLQYPDLGGLLSSQNDPAVYGNFSTMYDNFALSQTATITEFAWIGGYWNGDTLPGTMTGVTLTFYTDAAGLPGSVIWSGWGPGNFGEFPYAIDGNGSQIYVYDATLGGGPTLSANTVYWVSVVPDVVFPPQWGWATSSDGDGYSVQSWYGTYYTYGTDLAFGLAGDPTPEPGSLMLLGTGVIGLAGVIRRKLS